MAASSVKSTIRISRDELQVIAEKMQAVPHAREADFTSKKEAIDGLSTAIKSMRDKGYSVAQIADWLTKNTPLEVTVATLRSAMSGKRRRRANFKSGTTKSAAKTAASAPKSVAGADPEVKLVEPDRKPPVSGGGKGSFALGSDEI